MFVLATCQRISVVERTVMVLSGWVSLDACLGRRCSDDELDDVERKRTRRRARKEASETKRPVSDTARR